MAILKAIFTNDWTITILGGLILILISNAIS